MADPFEEKPSGYYLFGQDIFAIPCFRTGALAGLLSCTATSLVTFLFTSNTKKSCNYAMGAFFVATFPYMFYCQYDFFNKLQKMEEVQEAVKNRNEEEYVIKDSLIDGIPPDVIA